MAEWELLLFWERGGVVMGLCDIVSEVWDWILCKQGMIVLGVIMLRLQGRTACQNIYQNLHIYIDIFKYLKKGSSNSASSDMFSLFWPPKKVLDLSGSEQRWSWAEALAIVALSMQVPLSMQYIS